MRAINAMCFIYIYIYMRAEGVFPHDLPDLVRTSNIHDGVHRAYYSLTCLYFPFILQLFNALFHVHTWKRFKGKKKKCSQFLNKTKREREFNLLLLVRMLLTSMREVKEIIVPSVCDSSCRSFDPSCRSATLR